MKNVGDTVALTPPGLVDACDGFGPRRWLGGISREEIGDILIRKRVVGGEASNPGESADVDRDSGGRGRQAGMREHRTLLSQSVARSVKLWTSHAVGAPQYRRNTLEVQA